MEAAKLGPRCMRVLLLGDFPESIMHAYAQKAAAACWLNVMGGSYVLLIIHLHTVVISAVIAQLAARRSHNPKVVSSILTHHRHSFRMFLSGQNGERYMAPGACVVHCRSLYRE